MTPTLTRRRPAQRKLGGHLLVGAGILGTTLVGAALLPGLRSPGHVGRVTVTNPTVYDVQVDAAGGARDGWLDLGTADRESTASALEVLDQGRMWVLRFSHGGRGVGEAVMPRDELRRRGWTVSVPAEVAARLAASGVPASAR